jgi:hypothetical protein
VSRWLYQMSEASWPSEEFRREIWEGAKIRWPTRHVMFAGGDLPSAGDLIICFYAPSDSLFPGICGFGIITRYLVKSRRFDWLPLPPTESLKYSPWWDDRVIEIIDSVRRQSPRGTMYKLPAALDSDLRRGSFAWARRHPS